MLLTFSIMFTLLYAIFLLHEKRSNDKRLASFRYVVHVNGIRGKTSVCRLLDAVFRENGFRVFTKTTGTTPFYIDTHGREHEIRRRGPAQLREQLGMIRRAYREQADVLILECMAVNPGLQRVAQDRLVKGGFNVITNVRFDHIFEMGASLDSIAESLSGTIPCNGLLLTADEHYFPYFKDICGKKHTQAILCKPDANGAMSENVAIAREAAKYLGLSDAEFQHSIAGYQEDFGSHRLYPLRQGASFLNLFSVNDPLSTKKILEEYAEDPDETIFIYNHRQDRPDRLLLFASHFFPEAACKKIVVTGENRLLAKMLLLKNGCSNVETAKSPEAVLKAEAASLFVGIGNIRGQAGLISRLERGNAHE